MELLVVMLVMVLAAAAIAPSFLQFRKRTLLQTAARRTIALAGEARSLAVMRDTTVTLAYDENAHILRLTAEPAVRDDNPEEPPGPEPLNERQLPDTRVLEYPYEVEVEASGPAPAIRFSGDGRADPGEIRLEAEDLEPILLRVNPRTGRIRVVEEAL